MARDLKKIQADLQKIAKAVFAYQPDEVSESIPRKLGELETPNIKALLDWVDEISTNPRFKNYFTPNILSLIEDAYNELENLNGMQTQERQDAYYVENKLTEQERKQRVEDKLKEQEHREKNKHMERKW